LKKIFALSILSLILFSAVFTYATCSYGNTIDQQQTSMNNFILVHAFEDGAGTFPRSLDKQAQSFTPSASGELPQVAVYGNVPTFFNPSINIGCTTANGASIPLGGSSGAVKIAQRFFVDTSAHSYNWATIRWRMLKFFGASFDPITVSLNSESGGFPGAALAWGTLDQQFVWNTGSYNTYTFNWEHGNSIISSSGYYWIVFSVPMVNPGVYNFQGQTSLCPIAGSARAAYYDTSWHSAFSDFQIYFQMDAIDPAAYSSTCLQIYSDSSNNPGSFIQSAFVSLPYSADSWSTWGGWRTGINCTGSSTPTGPSLVSGTKYWLSVEPLYESDYFLWYQDGGDPYPSGEIAGSFYWNPTYLHDSASDLVFRTYKCATGPTPTPTITPTPTPTPTPTGTPTPTATPTITPSVIPCTGGSYEGQPCTQNCDCHVGLRCNPDTHTCQKLMDKVKSFGWDMFGLNMSMLEFGLVVVMIAFLFYLLMGRRND